MKKSLGWHLRRGIRSLGRRIARMFYEQFGDVEKNLAPYAKAGGTRRLDLGCGTAIRNPFKAAEAYGVDIRLSNNEKIRCADLSASDIPFPDEYFDFVSAFDFLEHVPRVSDAAGRRFPFVSLMNEIYRVLVPGGVFFCVTPAFPFSVAFRDPTHVNFITEETFERYFDDKSTLAAMYGFIGRFQLLKQGWRDGHLIVLLKKL